LRRKADHWSFESVLINEHKTDTKHRRHQIRLTATIRQIPGKIHGKTKSIVNSRPLRWPRVGKLPGKADKIDI
jgi:hypothetical protein